jgi:CRP-like cAMP-binding protein
MSSPQMTRMFGFFAGAWAKATVAVAVAIVTASAASVGLSQFCRQVIRCSLDTIDVFSSEAGASLGSRTRSLADRDKENWKILYNSRRKSIDISPLNKLGWLADQSPELHSWASEVGQWRSYDAGQAIYQADDPADGLYGLAEGAIQIAFPLPTREQVFLHRAEVGFWIGDLAELASAPRLVSVVSATNSRLLHISSEKVRRLLDYHPWHWPAFYRLSVSNMRMALTLLSEALSLTVRARVCRRLLALSEANPDIEITQETLSELLGVTRPTLRRCLLDLEERGAIARKYSRLSIIAPLVLKAFCDER